MLSNSQQTFTGRLPGCRAVATSPVVVCDEGGQVVFRNGTVDAAPATAPSDILAEQAVRETLAQARMGSSPSRDAVPASRRRGVSVHLGEMTADACVVGDRRQLVSALFNLIDNAIKYSDEGRRVVVDAVALQQDGRDPRVELRVRDEGIGIPARDRERIFERFYRVDKARARDTGGTGLGLAIVRHVVGNHAGEVTVASLEGEGSTFTVRLPLHSLKAPAPEVPAHPGKRSDFGHRG